MRPGSSQAKVSVENVKNKDAQVLDVGFQRTPAAGTTTAAPLSVSAPLKVWRPIGDIPLRLKPTQKVEVKFFLYFSNGGNIQKTSKDVSDKAVFGPPTPRMTVGKDPITGEKVFFGESKTITAQRPQRQNRVA